MTNTQISEEAAAFFEQKPKAYNCAQAVVKAFARDDLLEAMQSCGGGRAPGGLCGALYAVLTMLPEDQHDKIKEQFQNAAGDFLCRPIRQQGKTSCTQCVRMAAEILQRHQMESKESKDKTLSPLPESID